MEEDSHKNGTQAYTMSKALECLHSELAAEAHYHDLLTNRRCLRKNLSLFHHSHVKSLYHWTTAFLSLLIALLLIVAFYFDDDREAKSSDWLIVEAVLLIFSVTANICLNLIVGQQERYETVRLVRRVLADLAKCINYNTWNGSCFTPLDAPQSPSMTLQWTIRDNEVINLPTVLLVKGDIIYLRPGQTAPATCKEILDVNTAQDTVSVLLNEGDIFNPVPAGDTESVNAPRTRSPLKPQKFLLLDTPYVSCLRDILRDADRPSSIIEHEKHYILLTWVERRIMPIFLVLSMVVNGLRYMYLRDYVGNWTEMLITMQIHTLLPLISMGLPFLWFILNSYGQARVFAAFEAAKESMSLCEASFDTDSSISADEARINLQWANILDWFKVILLGKAPAVSRKINIAHILGSVTSLCCVDKKGILSYPNPSPEKVFFLQNHIEDGQKEHILTESHSHNTELDKDRKTSSKKAETEDRHHSFVEVLDLTHDPKKSYGLHFDDPGWKQYLNSLKPLGLTILANTCNPKTVEWYSQFTDHVACAALENEETVAVVNKRCLCSLARQIGFSEKAVEIFKLEKTLGLYRQVSAEATTKERLQRAKSFIQNKIPMPNMVSVIVRETISGSCQLLSHGTAEILLNCCSDYWNGHDLTELTENDRKRVLDFYHRTSIGSYCSAFSYRPISKCLSRGMSDMYIELPCDSHLFTSAGECWDSNHVDEGVDVGTDPMWKGQRSFSVDSLFDTSSISSTEDATDYFQSQCNQIFIGMVTMQYQARQDFIQLIDKLEGACIRFVHFSHENEVRSRVFSEKMGLEAGWNCHISLRSEKQYLSSVNQSDRDQEGFSSDEGSQKTSRCSSRHPSDSKQKTDHPVLNKKYNASNDMSRSAPSIVNLGSSQVKFEKKVKATIVSPRKVRRHEANEYRSASAEEVMLLNHDSKLGSHLPQSVESVIEIEEDLVVDSDDGESKIASSYVTENTEDSLTGVLDNRAKLPRGIENIRPHLRSTDNVPLLVNLFTDCTPETTCEMIAIMQEHGEVVLCVGSSLNKQNVPMFLLADCSIALEPWYPQVCLHSPYVPSSFVGAHPTPSELAGSLLSIICPLMIGRKENISLVHLIAEARSHLKSMRTCFYFILCCSLSLSLTQLLASTLLFPPVLAPQHLLWLLLFIIPLLGLTMMGNPVDARVMTLATKKNKDHITLEMLIRFIVYNLLRFVPPVLTALFCYGRVLLSYCYTHPASHNGTSCAIYDFVNTIRVSNSLDQDKARRFVGPDLGPNCLQKISADDTRSRRSRGPAPNSDWYLKFSGGIVLAQNILLFLLVLYFEIISVSFVHWTDHIWQQCPTTNKLWLAIIPVLLLCQVLFFICDIFIRNGAVSHTMSLSEVVPDVWAVGLAAPLVFVAINELIKHREIKINVRYQKRARLDFGTKLGMNSPF